MLSAIAKQVQKRYPEVTEEILQKNLVVLRMGENEMTMTKFF